MIRRVAWLIVAAAVAAAAAEKAPEDPLDAEARKMLDLVNRDRAEHKLAPLAWHEGAAAMGKAHSQDMRDHHFFGHDSKRTGTAKDRVAAARLLQRGSAENLARGPNIEWCQKALMASPGHRANLLQPDFTHLGIGIARGGDGMLLVSQEFLRVPPMLLPADMQKAIEEGVNKLRLAKGLRRLVPDDALMQRAQAHSDRAAELAKADPLWLENRLMSGDNRWRIHEAAYFLTESADDVINSQVALSTRPDHYGVGVAPAPTKSKLAGALWVTLICAQKR